MIDMADTKYKLRHGQKLTQEQLREIEASREKPIVFDEDSPEIDPEKSPALYAAMMNAVGARNRRIAGKNRNLA